MHLIVILVIVLIVFGPGKLTEMGGQLGKGVKEFRQLSEGDASTTSAKQHCTDCGAIVANGATFCSACGHAVRPAVPGAPS